MRRYSICLLCFLLLPVFSLCWCERGADSASSSKGLTSNTCGNNPGPSDPYSNRRFSLAPRSATSSSGTIYVSTVDVYAWGDYNCALYVAGNPASGENASTEDTILGITISTSAGAPPPGSYKLLSFRLNNYLPASPTLGYVSCQNSGITPCDNQSENDFSPVPEPAPISGADGSGSLWTLGNIFQLSGTSTGSTPSGPAMQLATTPPQLAAALLVAGCTPDPSATPPQDCIGPDKANYGNGLSPQTTYTIEIEDTSTGQILVLGTPPSPAAASGRGHDVFSATTYNPVSIPAGVFSNQIFDLSDNYPQLDGTGAPAFNGFAPSAFPPPCATNAGICTADDTFADVSFHSMWFDFVPQMDSPVSVSTANSHFDTILSVFTGGANSLQGVPNGLNDDNPNATLSQGPRSSAVVFQGAKGVTYHILVSEYPRANPLPDPGFDLYEAPLTTDPILYLTLTTPQLTLSPSTLQDFGSVIQGASSGAQTVTVAAAYSASSSGINNIMPAITAGSGDFQIASNSTCLPALADQATCTLNILFAPAGTGKRSGTLTLNSSAYNSPLTLALSGTGLQAMPILDLSTAPLSFPSQLLQTSSSTSSVVLTNAGSAPMTVSAVSSTGDFSQTNNCSSIPASGQCSVAVRFTPTQTGSRSGQLSITDNAGNSPQVIPLSGMGTDFALQAAPGSQLSATVAPGTTATYNVAVTPIAGFAGVVALSCTGAPAGDTCTPSTTSVDVNGSPASITVSVTSAAAAKGIELRPLSTVVFSLGLFPFVAGTRRKFLLTFACAGLLLFFSGLVGCGGGGSAAGAATTSSAAGGAVTTQPQPVTTVLTLSGVSGAQTRMVALTLTVQ